MRVLLDIIRQSLATLGAQAALIPDHVWNCMGRGLASLARWLGGRFPQRPETPARDVRSRHYVCVSWPHPRFRGKLAVGAEISLYLRRLLCHPRAGAHAAQRFGGDP